MRPLMANATSHATYQGDTVVTGSVEEKIDQLQESQRSGFKSISKGLEQLVNNEQQLLTNQRDIQTDAKKRFGKIDKDLDAIKAKLKDLDAIKTKLGI
jgi:hypothetical protein